MTVDRCFYLDCLVVKFEEINLKFKRVRKV